MQNRRDSSAFRGLAGTLGDALAFGAGMKLAQAARKPAADSSTESVGRGAIETAIDAAVSARIETSVSALRSDIEAMHLDFARTLGGLLAEQVEIQVRERSGEDLGRLRSEIAQTHREFAEAVGRIVSEQIETKLKNRSAELERRLLEEAASLRGEIVRVHEDFAESMTAYLNEQVESQVLARASAIQSALAAQIETAVAAAVREESVSIRKETVGAQAAMANFLTAVGTACRDAAEKAANAPPEPPQGHSDGSGETRGPEFSQLKKTGALFQIPMVSSIILVAGGLLLAHYL